MTITPAGWTVLNNIGGALLILFLLAIGAFCLWCLYKACWHLHRAWKISRELNEEQTRHLTAIRMWTRIIREGDGHVLGLTHAELTMLARAKRRLYGERVKAAAEKMDREMIKHHVSLIPVSPPVGGSSVRPAPTEDPVITGLRQAIKGVRSVGRKIGRVQVYAEDGTLLIDTGAEDPTNPPQPEPYIPRRSRRRDVR